jgi:hypothetical protein
MVETDISRDTAKSKRYAQNTQRFPSAAISRKNTSTPHLLVINNSDDVVYLAVIISICTCEHEISIVSEDRPGFEGIISTAATGAWCICAACQNIRSARCFDWRPDL